MYSSRSISRLLASLRKNDDTLTHLLDIDEEVGQDFLFLFDLLSHTSGTTKIFCILVPGSIWHLICMNFPHWDRFLNFL